MQSKEERCYREMMNTKLLLLFSAYFVALGLYGVCVYQCVLVMKTNATAASAISAYARGNNDSGCAEARKQTSWARQQQTTNKRTDERRRASADAAPTAELLSYERTRGRSRARARAAAALVPSNQRTNARARAIAAAVMVLSNGLRCEPRRIRQTPTVSQSIREPIFLPNRGLSFGPQLRVLLGGVHVQ
jgi:hypothetical protein